MPAPSATRRSPLEGWYWRVVDPAAGRVLVALCGVCRPRRGAPWAVAALAAHPGGVVRWATVDGAAGDERGFGARAAPLLRGTDAGLRAAVGDVSLDLEIRDPVVAPRPSLGAAHALPGLPQYWHAHLLGGAADGTATIAGERWALHGARVYAEKNWGPRFAPDWWWGQAFAEERVEVSFAGGRLGPLAPTAVVVRIADSVHRLVAPWARVTADVSAGRWRIAARGARLRVEIEGDAAGGEPHRLPVPDVEGRRCEIRSDQHLAGRLRLVVREGRRLRFSGETRLAGLERGLPPGAPPG